MGKEGEEVRPRLYTASECEFASVSICTMIDVE